MNDAELRIVVDALDVGIAKITGECHHNSMCGPESEQCPAMKLYGARALVLSAIAPVESRNP